MGATGRRRGLRGFARHNITFRFKMAIHSNIGILPRPYGNWYLAQRACSAFRFCNVQTQTTLTIRCDSIEFRFIVVPTTVGFNFEVFLTERLLAVLAIKGQEIDKATNGVRALFADIE